MTLVVDHVYKQFKTREVLSDISFEVTSNEIVGLLGPNGAGKSTLMNLISGALIASEGKVFVNGYDISDDSVKAKLEIGYLPENNPLYSEMYVCEYLEFCASLYKKRIPNKRIEDLIDECGLKDVNSFKIETLSKGYRQRLGLAQAILHNPRILILDEPASGLDPNQQQEMKQLIRKLSKNTLILFSTHILQEVEDLCDRILIINNGRIVKDCQLIDNKTVGNISLQEVYEDLTKY